MAAKGERCDRRQDKSSIAKPFMEREEAKGS
jgi:hypothetical protein